MMLQTQVVFLIGYSVIFIYAIAIFGLIWQMSKKKTKKKQLKHKNNTEPKYNTQTIAFYVSLCFSLLALGASIIGLIITT